MRINSASGHPAIIQRDSTRKGGMNGQEAEYFAILRHAFPVVHFEPHTFEFGHRCTYTPDFFVITESGEHQYHEVKGHRWPASIVKFKVCANLWREAAFFLCTKKRGIWRVKRQEVIE